MASELESMKQVVDRLRERLEDENNVAGATTILTRETGLVSLAQSYSSTTKTFLGKLIRHQVFKKYKVTNKRTFESGEIQRMCHSQLGLAYMKPDVMLAYRDRFIKMVNYELGQKRNQVNEKLLKKWKGMSSVCVVFYWISFVTNISLLALLLLNKSAQLDVMLSRRS